MLTAPGSRSTTIEAERRDAIEARVGHTPLLLFRRLKVSWPVKLYGKAKWFNASGSVRDRPVLARNEGILVGPSSGAAVAASVRISNEIEQATVVTIRSDSGRYLSKRFWRAST